MLSSRRGGFTLIEMLVVIGIILVLAAILLPAITKAYKSAQRASMTSDLNAISVALEAYKKDFHDYPRVVKDPGTAGFDARHPNPMTGAQMLAFALMGPAPATDASAAPSLRPIQDGSDGFGFRTQRAGTSLQGKTWPAYLQNDRFRCMDPMDPTAPAETNNVNNTNALRFCLLDRNNKPILYFPASPAKPNVKAAPTGLPAVAPYVDRSESSLYDADDNALWFSDDPTAYANVASTAVNAADAPAALKRIRVLLGETVTPNGVIEQGENATDLPFLLWGAGPDERFGPGTDMSTGAAITDGDRKLFNQCDDVTNFRP